MSRNPDIYSPGDDGGEGVKSGDLKERKLLMWLALLGHNVLVHFADIPVYSSPVIFQL